MRIYTEIQKAKASKRKKAWYLANKEKALARSKAWNLANKEKTIANGKAWNLANKEKIAAKNKKSSNFFIFRNYYFFMILFININ